VEEKGEKWFLSTETSSVLKKQLLG
jgi:hypothetical protein